MPIVPETNSPQGKSLQGDNPQGNKTAAVPTFRVQPFRLSIDQDLDRGKDYVELRFRHKRPGPLPEQLDLVEIVVEDLAAAGLSVGGAITLTLTPRADGPQGGKQGAKPPSFGSVLEVPVQVPGDVRAWCDALRAEAATKKAERQ